MAEEIVVVGVEPAHIATGIGLSPQVEAALPAAIGRARAVLESMLRRKAESKTLQRVISPVLSHIDAIHRVPALPSIPVVREGSELKPGAYEYIKSSGRPVKIGVQPNSLTPRLTFAHEVWHFIEHQGIGTIGAYETETDPRLRPILAAARSSDTARYLKMLQRRQRWPVDLADGSRANKDIDRRYVEYLLQGRELLARGYAQYVASKSGDPVMADELARIRRRPARSIY